ALPNLIQALYELTQQYAPNGLAQYQITPNNLAKVIKNCRSGSMLGNPVQLTDQQLLNALKQAI
ncbi:MAG: alcohol dehydrogenase, partial [Thiomicrorhabdus sp.]|nr:alcohol dehydrogenase [Thiomicrorhabdus sp.]